MKNWRTFSLKSLLIITTLSAVFVAYRIYQFEQEKGTQRTQLIC